MNFVSVSNNQAQSGGIFRNNMVGSFTYNAASPFDNSPKANILFTTQKWQKANIIAPYTMKVKDLLSLYIQKLGLGPGVMGVSLFFLFNGKQIDLNEQSSIFDLGLHNGGNILVLDIKEVIGA